MSHIEFRSGRGDIPAMGEMAQASITEIADFLAGTAPHPIVVAKVPIQPYVAVLKAAQSVLWQGSSVLAVKSGLWV
jgi:hypothetical protein